MPLALIIEDDPDAGETLATLLEQRGWTTARALAGEEGLHLAQSLSPAIIFLDLMLPDMDGYKVCAKLKMDRATNPIPVIVVSALTAPESQIEGLRVGADAYLFKPYLPDDLDVAIAKAREHEERIRTKTLELSIRFDLESRVENLHAVNELIGMLLRHSKMSEHEASQLRTAMFEIGQNAIEWGNKHDATKTVSISAEVSKDRIIIHVEDEGEGFNPRNIPHALADAEDPTAHLAVREMLGLREGGFGLQIVKGMMDEVTYNERGNKVTMVKHLTESAQ